MTPTRDRLPEIDQLLQGAGAAPMPELSSTDARRMVRRAMLAGQGRRRTPWLLRGHTLAAFGVGAACALGLLVMRVGIDERPSVPQPTAVLAPPAPPLEVHVQGDDRLWAEPGARFGIAVLDGGERRIQLDEGAGAFGVGAGEAGASFSVATPHLEVRVTGTVFTVVVRGARTGVQVYEGEVEVEQDGLVWRLGPGGHHSNDGEAVVIDPEHAVLEAARQEARRRLHAPAAPGGAGLEAAIEAAMDSAPAGPESNGKPSLTLEGARALLHGGQAERALSAARAAQAPATLPRIERGRWRLLEADSLRSLGDASTAYARYRSAALLLDDRTATRAGYKAAALALHELDNPAMALLALDEGRTDAPGSPLRERALLLRAEAAQRLGKPIGTYAESYLREFPSSAGAARMRALLDDAQQLLPTPRDDQ